MLFHKAPAENGLQTHKRLKRTLTDNTKCVHIFRVNPFFKQQIDTQSGFIYCAGVSGQVDNSD